MTEKPYISSSLPTKTVLFYLIVGIVFFGGVSALYFYHINWTTINSVGTLLNLLSGVVFAILAMICFYRCTKKVDFYDDRIVRKSILGTTTTTFKEVNGHFVDGRPTDALVDVRGYFRGIIVRKKNGSHFSLNKAELGDFDEIKKYFRSRCKYFNTNSGRKLAEAEDRKLFAYTLIILLIVIASLLH